MDLKTVTMDNLSDLLQNILDKAERTKYSSDELRGLIILTDIDKEAIKMARDRLSPTFKPSSYSYPNNLLYEMGFDVENTNILTEDIETAISLCLSGTEQEFIHRYYRDGKTVRSMEFNFKNSNEIKESALSKLIKSKYIFSNEDVSDTLKKEREAYNSLLETEKNLQQEKTKLIMELRADIEKLKGIKDGSIKDKEMILYMMGNKETSLMKLYKDGMLSHRAYYCLHRGGYDTTMDLYGAKYTDLSNLTNVGKSTLEEIVTFMKSNGIPIQM